MPARKARSKRSLARPTAAAGARCLYRLARGREAVCHGLETLEDGAVAPFGEALPAATREDGVDNEAAHGLGSRLLETDRALVERAAGLEMRSRRFRGGYWVVVVVGTTKATEP